MMDDRYTAVSNPPKDALKEIEFGALRGKSDINPQWKIEAMTEKYGMCGIGWKFEIVDIRTTCMQDDGRILLFMQVNLFIKDGENWSAPIPGYGGDMIVKKNKNGIEPNDEAYKMCLTDALGNALKYVGVAASVYRGFYETKHEKRQADKREEKKRQEESPIQITSTSASGYVRFINGIQCQVKSTRNNEWYDVEYLTLKNLEEILEDEKYSDAYDAIRLMINSKAAGMK